MPLRPRPRAPQPARIDSSRATGDNDDSVHILVAEDDRDIADLISHYIEKAGWTSHAAASGDAALAYARATPVDVVVLDVMLPGLSGLEVCRALRADPATAAIAIIMVTARAEEADRIVGLEIGADDYVSKPFSPNELLARIRALVRRTRRTPATDGSTLSYGPIVMDTAAHTVSESGREVALTAKEFVLLRYLLERPGRVVSRDVLLADVWGYSYTGGTRTVDVHVRRLREKVPSLVDLLVTVKQFGYKLDDAAAGGTARARRT